MSAKYITSRCFVPDESPTITDNEHIDDYSSRRIGDDGVQRRVACVEHELSTRSTLTAAERIELIMSAIAAYEIPSADLHWRLLSPTERKQSSVPQIISAFTFLSRTKRLVPPR